MTVTGQDTIPSPPDTTPDAGGTTSSAPPPPEQSTALVAKDAPPPVEQDLPRIPRILHICWVGPHAPPIEMIESWEKKHGGDRSWFFQLWRDHRQGWTCQEQIDARAAKREWNGVADIMRYEILYRFGGFAVDADSTCIKALDEGPIDFLNNATAVACFENESVRPGVIGCGFLGAPKHHPFFEACIEEVQKTDAKEMAWKAVGPLLMGRVASRMPKALKVYPARHFNPKHYSGTQAPGAHAIYAEQGWGSTKSYNSLRRVACQCEECRITFLRAPWM
jgi:mannosyltransferase OCH1-like enzyme